MSRDAVVIGAGISGLAIAQDLVSRGYDVRVLERQTTVGGNAATEQFGGFLMEKGPTTMNAAFPEAMERVDALGLGSSAVDLGAGVQKRYLLDQQKLQGISVHPLGFFLSDYLSLRAKLSLLAELFRPRGTAMTEETIHGFVSRRFGVEFADKVIDPMAAGIFMGDSRALSIDGAFPKLVDLEQKHGSIIRGILAAKRGSEPGRRLFSWPLGIATLPRRLQAQLKSRIQTGVTVTRISRNPGGFEVTTAKHGTLCADLVVLAVQPHVATALLEQLDPETAEATGSIQAPPVGVVFLGYKRTQVAHPLDGLGFLRTRGPGQIISGAQFCSTMFEGRAPKGHVSISCYVGGMRNSQAARLPRRALIEETCREVSDILGISGEPVVARAHHWPQGLPQYTLKHRARRTVIENLNQRVPGLYVTGNFLGGVSIANCLVSARTVADRIEADFRPGAKDPDQASRAGGAHARTGIEPDTR